MVRDEADIVGETVGHMLSQVDEVVVLDNRSRDNTREILESLGARAIDDPEVGFRQSEKMTRLAHSLDADWVVPFDADEVWQTRGGERIADTLAALPEEAMVCEAEVFAHVATALDAEGPPVRSLAYRRPRPMPHRKVACRVRPTLRLTHGNHGVHYGSLALKADGLLEVRHFPVRSPEQMIRKIRNHAEAVAATDLPSALGARWRDQAGRSDGELRELFRALHFSDDAEGLVYDPCLLTPPAPAGALG